MTPEFERAIGGLADIPQWFVWRLEWDAQEGKYIKTPWRRGHGAVGGADSEMWLDYDAACALVRDYNVGVTELVRYVLGFWLTDECGYWFLDIDMRKCGLDNYRSTTYADTLVAQFPNAMTEWSSGLKGLHIIGSLDGESPAHRCKPERDMAAKLAPLELEFYTDGRGIAFGIDGMAWGCADTRFNVQPLVDTFFKPRPVTDSGQRVEWRGPADDDVLLERALSSRVGAASAFGHKVTLAQLFRGDAPKNNESDMALASHLAFWTGCDEDRIERLMRRSGLVRAKWDDRRRNTTYLRYSISRACESCENVYQEPERNLTVQNALYAAPPAPAALPSPGEVQVMMNDTPTERISAEVFARVGALLDDVAACGDELSLHNIVIPAIQSAGVPGALQERLVQAIKTKLAFWDNKMGVAKIRALLFPAAIRVADESNLPEWAEPYCWVTNGDKFFNTFNCQTMTMLSFQATYGRFMGVNDQGRRENAAEKCLHFWGMPVVEQTGYRPDQGPFFDWDGVSYANLYSPSSLPPTANAYTEAGLAGINAFQTMLFEMCGRREPVYLNLLYWMAHNVQRPGVKIRWSPLIKGVHGDGKTLTTVFLRAAMGHRNLRPTSNATLSNSGGFTDWAVRSAVNVIEEIMLTGKQRHQLYNAMKEFVTNDVVDVNPKGATSYQTFNVTNHWINTNHNDGMPLEKTDRRILVVFTPWASLAEMNQYAGLSAEQMRARIKSIDNAIRNCAGEIRAWFLSVPIPADFDVDGSAMMTPEKLRMMASSSDDAESVALSVILNGGVGVTENVISSSHLSRILMMRAQNENFEVPRGVALNHMLTRLGYSKLEKQVKWNGQTFTIWLKNGIELDNDQVRLALDSTNPTQTPTQT